METLPGPTRHYHHDDRSVELHHAFMCSCALAQIAPPFAAAPKALPGSIKIGRLLLKLLYQYKRHLNCQIAAHDKNFFSLFFLLEKIHDKSS
jgi:hypothetical protein